MQYLVFQFSIAARQTIPTHWYKCPFVLCAQILWARNLYGAKGTACFCPITSRASARTTRRLNDSSNRDWKLLYSHVWLLSQDDLKLGLLTREPIWGPHVALGFSLHGCWVSRASISRDNVLEKSSKRPRKKPQYFF